MGVCVPEECSVSDVTKLLNSTSLCLQQYFNSKYIYIFCGITYHYNCFKFCLKFKLKKNFFFLVSSKIIIVRPLSTKGSVGVGYPMIGSICYSDKTYSSYTTGATVMM